jgi:hypothetical protein
MYSHLSAVKRIEASGDARAGDDTTPVEHLDGVVARLHLGGVDRARGDEVLVRDVNARHGRVVHSGQAADVAAHN